MQIWVEKNIAFAYRFYRPFTQLFELVYVIIRMKRLKITSKLLSSTFSYCIFVREGEKSFNFFFFKVKGIDLMGVSKHDHPFET